MAQIPLKSIKFPGLPDTYTVDPGLSEEAKVALLACFENVAWVNENGQDYYDDLYDALYQATGLVSISAVFTQGSAVINEGDDLNTLKQYLVVTGYYSDGVSQVITDYALSGQLTEGTSTISVTKEGKTATFNVTVTANNIIKVFFGKGTSGSNIIDNTKRFITEPILFNTNMPLTIQYSGCAEYNVRYAPKIIDNQGNIWIYNSSIDEVEVLWRKNDNVGIPADNDTGWITDGTELVSCRKYGNGPYTYQRTNVENTNGSFRLIFADINSLDNIPNHSIGGTLVVQGNSYTLTGRDKNEFI